MPADPSTGHPAPAPPLRSRLAVAKTVKLFVGGAFVRPESGRVIDVVGPAGRTVALPATTRKDLRDAVVAARAAQGGWAARSGYNRGQVLYRMAEMLEARRAQYVEAVAAETGPWAEPGICEAEDALDAAIDQLVSDAGWADKATSVLGCANSVAGPYLNVSVPEPCGVVGLVPPGGLAAAVEALGAALCAANTVVVLAGVHSASAVLALGEVCASADVPPGVVNLLTYSDEAALTMATHGDVNALDLRGAPEPAALERAAAATLKRLRPSGATGPGRLSWCTETKTLWHPVGM